MISLPVMVIVVFILSLIFDQFVAKLNRMVPTHPFLPLFVVVGVLYSLMAVYVVDGYIPSELACGTEGWLRWDHLIIIFAASGTPMFLGSLIRWVWEHS